MAFSPDSKRVFVGSGKTVEVVDLDPPARRKIGPMSAPISTIEPTPKGDFLAVGLEDGHATFYDTKEWKPGARVDAPSGGVTTVRVSRNGKTGVILGDSPKARLFRPDTGQVVRDVEPSMNPWDAGLSVDGKRVTLVDAASVTEWEVETGRKYIEEGVDTGGTFPIATSDDGAWAASSSEDGHALSLWGVHPWVKHPKLLHVDTCAQHVIGIRFSADGKLLFATRLDGPRYAFKTETRAQRASWTPKPEKGELASAVMSEDADTVAASWTAGGTALYRTSDGAEIRSLDKGGPTQRLVFSMDGRHVLGVRDSGEVVVWSVVTGQEEAKIAPSK